jgi:hypothetical protein
MAYEEILIGSELAPPGHSSLNDRGGDTQANAFGKSKRMFADLYALINATYTVLTQNSALQPLTWTENSVACSATYNTDGTVATLTKGSVTRTYTYTSGVLTAVT